MVSMTGWRRMGNVQKLAALVKPCAAGRRYDMQILQQELAERAVRRQPRAAAENKRTSGASGLTDKPFFVTRVFRPRSPPNEKSRHRACLFGRRPDLSGRRVKRPGVRAVPLRRLRLRRRSQLLCPRTELLRSRTELLRSPTLLQEALWSVCPFACLPSQVLRFDLRLRAELRLWCRTRLRLWR